MADDRRVIVKIQLPCELTLLAAILDAMPEGLTLADTEQRGDEMWIYQHGVREETRAEAER